MKAPLCAAFAVLCAAFPARAQQMSYDKHFLDSTDYFVSPRAIAFNYDYVAVGRMITPPGATTHGQAQFLIVGAGANLTAGQRVWSEFFWRTRPVETSDVSVGQQVFCFNQNDGGVYRGPRSRAEAMSEGWLAWTITDVSNLFRQEVQAGDFRLGTSCLRVALPGKP